MMPLEDTTPSAKDKEAAKLGLLLESAREEAKYYDDHAAAMQRQAGHAAALKQGETKGSSLWKKVLSRFRNGAPKEGINGAPEEGINDGLEGWEGLGDENPAPSEGRTSSQPSSPAQGEYTSLLGGQGDSANFHQGVLDRRKKNYGAVSSNLR